MNSDNSEPSAPPESESGTDRPVRAKRATHDTTAGCRDRAEADLQSSREMNTVNGRLGMEKSAACWTARADLLQRLDDLSHSRLDDAAIVPPATGNSPEL